MPRFDPPALFAAVEAVRRQRGLTWTDVARQTGVAAATIRRTRDQGRFEVDGIIALTSWLGRPVEEFTRDGTVPPERLHT